jgi:hypothetical protein
MRLILTCLLLSLALPAAAQIYKYTDANGNTVFTNQPPQGVAAQPVELPPTNTVEMQIPDTPPSSDSSESMDGPPYRTLQLTGLPSNGALRENDGTFSVGVELEPRLASNHRLRLLLDGQPYGQPSNVPRLQLLNIARGEHSLAVEVLSGDEPIQQSDSVTFTVQRVHTSSPALRPAPPAPPANPAP